MIATWDGRGYTLLFGLFLVFFYTAWFFIWREHGALLFTLGKIWAASPTRWPFVDIMGVLSWNDCAAMGYDVYRQNPCTVVPLPFNYSPFLLELPLTAIGVGNTILAGYVLDALFLLTLPFILRPRTRSELLVAILACGSSVVLFALERANLDVFEFFLIALAGSLPLADSRLRILSYALGFFGGLLKFYPFVLLATILRERPARALLLGSIFAVLIAFFVYHYRDLWAVIFSHIPHYNAYGPSFGAKVLPYDVAYYLGMEQMGPYFFLPLFAVSVASASLLSGRILSVSTMSLWYTLQYRHLLNGALIVCACFYTQQNLYYRAIFVLLTLPGLFELMRLDPSLKRIMRLAIAAALLSLWSEPVRRWLNDLMVAIYGKVPASPPGDLPQIFHFLFREACWWYLVTILLAIAIAFAWQSPLGTFAGSIKDRIRTT